MNHNFKYKTFREKIKHTLQDLGLGNVFLLILKPAFIKRKTHELYIKIKNFCFMKHPVKRIERQGTEWSGRKQLHVTCPTKQLYLECMKKYQFQEWKTDFQPRWRHR